MYAYIKLYIYYMFVHAYIETYIYIYLCIFMSSIFLFFVLSWYYATPLNFTHPLPEDIYCILGWLDSHANCYVCITWPVLHPTLQSRVFCPVFQSPVASEFFS